jgi:hypothetical protein
LCAFGIYVAVKIRLLEFEILVSRNRALCDVMELLAMGSLRLINEFAGPIITFDDGRLGITFKQNNIGIAMDAALF